VKIEFIDGCFYKVIASKGYSRDYKMYKRGGKVVSEPMRQQKQLALIELLYERQRQT
jgi:hypothetical protein